MASEAWGWNWRSVWHSIGKLHQPLLYFAQVLFEGESGGQGQFLLQAEQRAHVPVEAPGDVEEARVTSLGSADFFNFLQLLDDDEQEVVDLNKLFLY